MQTYRISIAPQTAFGTSLKGDTLFGQLCWAVHRMLGESRLNALLKGYTNDEPFLVVSDAFPSGYLPMPSLPKLYWTLSEDQQSPSARKALKKRNWLPRSALSSPLTSWLEHHAQANALPVDAESRPHNTINRATNSTGTGAFAPYTVEQVWYREGQQLEFYLALDDARLTPTELESLCSYIGATGFGRDASTGLGKFTVAGVTAGWDIPEIADANAWLTLAPCAPQGLAWDNKHCYYKPFTRFGRHGDSAAITGQPYKTPILLADTAAVLTPQRFESRLFTGQGLGGDGSLSNAIKGTIHQGYAPVIPIRLHRDGDIGE